MSTLGPIPFLPGLAQRCPLSTTSDSMHPSIGSQCPSICLSVRQIPSSPIHRVLVLRTHTHTHAHTYIPPSRERESETRHPIPRSSSSFLSDSRRVAWSILNLDLDLDLDLSERLTVLTGRGGCRWPRTRTRSGCAGKSVRFDLDEGRLGLDWLTRGEAVWERVCVSERQARGGGTKLGRE